MANEPQPLLVYCNCPPGEAASKLAKQLVDTRLAACVNILPGVHSVYRWQDKLCEDNETLLLIKTSAAQFDALQSAIVAQHPYELPEIIAVPIQAGLPAYLDWINESLK